MPDDLSLHYAQAEPAQILAALDAPLDPLTVSAHDLRAAGWYNHATSTLAPGFPIGPNDVVLEASCAEAATSRFCAATGATLVLADTSPARLERAAAAARQAGGHPTLHQTDADPLPLPDASVTRVICQNTLQHLDNPQAHLAELVRAAAPGALFLLSVPDEMAETVLTHLAPQARFQKPNHQRIFTRTAFATLAESAGLTILRRHYTGSFWSIWWMLAHATATPECGMPDHPALSHWTVCWASVLASAQGGRIKRVLDSFLPQTQTLIAIKPGATPTAHRPREILDCAPPADLFDPRNDAAMPDLAYLALKDAHHAGWFDNATSELYTGFPIGADHRVLDLGCGDGGALAFAARAGAYVILADIDEPRINQARALIAEITPDRHEMHVTDANPLPLPDASVDRVICTEVLEHVEDPRATMSELLRVGKPGALYLVSVPDTVQEKLQIGLAPASYFEKPNHLRIFERAEFTKLLEESGLIIERQGYYGGFFAIWWLMFWTCNIPLEGDRRHPVLDNWARCWDAALEAKNGKMLKHVLDALIPKSQIAVARKPD